MADFSPGDAHNLLLTSFFTAEKRSSNVKRCVGSDCHYRGSSCSWNNIRLLVGGWLKYCRFFIATVQRLQHSKSFKSLLASSANSEALQMLVGVAFLYPASSQATRHTATPWSRVFPRSQHIPTHNLALRNGIKNCPLSASFASVVRVILPEGN